MFDKKAYFTRVEFSDTWQYNSFVINIVTVVNGNSHVMRNIYDDSTYIVDSVALT